MTSFVIHFVFCCVLTNLVFLQETTSLQSNTLHKCLLTSTNQFSFNALPGNGWDNLENVDKGRVLAHQYSSCQTSPDGRFLLPDNINLNPNHRSSVELSSEIFTHFNNYTSSTSKSINIDGSYHTPSYQISGSFSYDHQNVKNKQIKDKSAISRVELRYNIYSFYFQPDCPLDPIFKNRLLDIGSAITNEPNDPLYPKYLTELLVRDFGTHFTRLLDAGAILSKIDSLKDSYVSSAQSDKTKIEAAASFSMQTTFNLNIKATSTSDKKTLDEYNSNTASSRIETIGGTSFGSNFKVEDWEKDLERNLVAVDRRGDPLYYAITPRTLPELNKVVLDKLMENVKKAIENYYEANSRVGCMDMRSPNFNDDANIDSGYCLPPKFDFKFGGVYQTCHGYSYYCNEVEQKNPLTGDFSCPKNYKSVQLNDDTYQCKSKCSSFLWLFDYDCRTQCTYYKLFWCAPLQTAKNSDVGFYFGGFYSNNDPNPITKTQTCPPTYLAVKFGYESKICLSLDKNGIDNSIFFGGLYSCNMGNPLTQIDSNNAQYWSKGCPEGYSSNLAVIDRLCQLSYCVKTTSISSKRDFPLYRPPFINLNYGPNYSRSPSFQSPYGVSFEMNDKGIWQPKKSVIALENASSGKIIGFSFLGAVIIGAVFIIIFLGVHKYKLHHKNKQSTYKSFVKTNNSLEGDLESCQRSANPPSSVSKQKLSSIILLPPKDKNVPI